MFWPEFLGIKMCSCHRLGSNKKKKHNTNNNNKKERIGSSFYCTRSSKILQGKTSAPFLFCNNEQIPQNCLSLDIRAVSEVLQHWVGLKSWHSNILNVTGTALSTPKSGLLMLGKAMFYRKNVWKTKKTKTKQKKYIRFIINRFKPSSSSILNSTLCSNVNSKPAEKVSNICLRVSVFLCLMSSLA